MATRRRRLIVAASSIVLAVVGAATAPERQERRHFDHVAYLEAYRHVRDGAGLYEASIAGLEHIGAYIDQARALRQPWVFALWALLPEDALRWSFFFVVALGAAVVASRIARAPEVGLAVGVWAAVVGFHGDGGVDAWLLFELWAVPLVLGCCLAWLREYDWLAASLALGAMLLRETAVLLPLGMLAAAVWQRRSVLPWLGSIGIAGAVLAWHWHVAQDYLDPEGRSAELIGTGSIDAIARMTSFLVLPDVVGLVLWGVGIALLWRSALRPALPLALMPLAGLLVNRPYWGFLAMPLCITALGGLPPWPGRAASDAPPQPRTTEATTAP